MARQLGEITELIVDKAVNPGEGERFSDGRQPMVLSCGGIYVPRPRPLHPGDPLYHVLNTSNEKEPTKVVSNLTYKNLLQEILHKESMN